MSPRIPITLLFVGLTAMQSLTGADNSSNRLQELANRSPFDNTATKTASVASDRQPLEFRGVLEERGVRIFSIYDIVARRSTWFGLNRPMYDIRIEAYDETQQLITVVYQGRPLVLPLKGGRPMIPMEEMTSPPTAKVKEPNDYRDKPFRLGHVHEEILIRRTVRQPATASPVLPTTPINR